MRYQDLPEGPRVTATLFGQSLELVVWGATYGAMYAQGKPARECVAMAESAVAEMRATADAELDRREAERS